MRISEHINKDKLKSFEVKDADKLKAHPAAKAPSNDSQPPAAVIGKTTPQPPSPPPRKQPEAPGPETSAHLSPPSPRPDYMKRSVGIYYAAKQLEIAMPQNKEAVLKNAQISLSQVLAAVADHSKKDNLWERIWHVANDLTTTVALHSNIEVSLYPSNADTDPLVAHSVNSAVIAIELSKHFGKAEYSPSEIGAAALAHDLGIAMLGANIARDDANPAFREHVMKSVELLKDMKAPEAAKTMVGQHHERADGKGYPAGIQGGAFLISSQILAISETFERILEESVRKSEQQHGQHPTNYVQTTLDNFHMALDKDILKVFISLYGFYPNGTVVELTNRSLAVVIKQNEGFPLRPVVRIILDGEGNHPEQTKIIDFRSAPALAILRLVTNDGSEK